MLASAPRRFEREAPHSRAVLRRSASGSRARRRRRCRICRQMWTRDDGPPDGKHLSPSRDALLAAPDPDAAPGRILIGGGGEKKTLRLVGSRAMPQPVREQCGGGAAQAQGAQPHHLRQRGDRLRRDHKTAGTPIGDADGFVANVEAYAKLGIDLVVARPACRPAGDGEVVAAPGAARLSRRGRHRARVPAGRSAAGARGLPTAIGDEPPSPSWSSTSRRRSRPRARSAPRRARPAS